MINEQPWSSAPRPALAVLFLAGIACIAVPIVSAPELSHALEIRSDSVDIRVREPAVAGLFYPRDPVVLSNRIEGYLKAARGGDGRNLKALICPHAGYDYSGPVAATAYRLLQGKEYATVMLLAPSHYAAFRGAAVSSNQFFRTPLGTVPISTKAKEIAGKHPFVWEAPCRVQRPPWWNHASRAEPSPGKDTADTWEHSDEVQVPFLQQSLRSFELLPIVFGETDPRAAAEVLADYADDQTLWVISSDLSHFHDYDDAQRRDQRCVEAICALDGERLEGMEACGKTPIQTLIHLARLKGWQPRLLDCRNSGDTAGDKRRVVGYAALAFYGRDPTAESEDATAHSEPERQALLRLARATLEESLGAARPADRNAADRPATSKERKACFVTLTKQGQLRGCIGHLQPLEPLDASVMENTRNAALHDPRFSPVTADEVEAIRIEISILGDPRQLTFSSPEDLLDQLHPHRDGVTLEVNGHRSTYLPQVWEQLQDKVNFMNSLAHKAGCSPSAWRQPNARVSTYQVEAFHEPQ